MSVGVWAIREAVCGGWETRTSTCDGTLVATRNTAVRHVRLTKQKITYVSTCGRAYCFAPWYPQMGPSSAMADFVTGKRSVLACRDVWTTVTGALEVKQGVYDCRESPCTW